jgi:autophagy-related protein 18
MAAVIHFDQVYQRHSTICEMTFRTAILAMRLNRKRLVVVLESELYIYDISNMQMLKNEKTSPNPNGIAAIHDPMIAC